MYGASPIGTRPFTAPPIPRVFATAGASEHVLFLHGLDSDAATITSSIAAVSGLPLAHLQDIQPNKKCRFLANAVRLTLVCRPIAANAMAWLAHNLTAGGYLRVKGATTSAGLPSASVVDTGWRSAWPLGVKAHLRGDPNRRTLIRWSNEVLLGYWQIDIVDGSGLIDFLEVGRLLFGRSYQTRFNADTDGGIGFTPLDKLATSEFGSSFPSRRRTVRDFDLKFSAIEEDEASELVAEMMLNLGGARDVFCVLDPAATTRFHDHSLHALISGPIKTVPQSWWSERSRLWSASVPLRELL